MALEATPNFGPHLPEESLEKYAFGRLPAGELEAVEEHLLVCESCRDRLESEDNFAGAMQLLAQMREPSASPSGLRRARSCISERAGPLGRPPALFAALILILLTGLVVERLAVTTQEAQPIALAALRGGEQSMPRADAGRALAFSIDLQTIADSWPAAGDYRLELVDRAGTSLWSGTASAATGKLGARMGQHLAAGTYWVRLYAPGGKLLREFGLEVQ